jgi:CRP/FNR family cyclic AMP-dependent transcriptional regulator
MTGIPRKVLKHFRSVPLFSNVSAAGLAAIVSAADEIDQPAGKVLVSEGEFRRELFVLLSGSATVSRDGREFAVLGPGDFFGEISLLSGGPRTATVTAASDVRVMILGPARFETVLASEPTIQRDVLSALGSRLRTLDTHALD